ncbi:MAG: hypothetical protein Q8M92_06930 [Candidatus Subteraquimicrobiales bacterium]|nr:hypothetical protein [Candidatus Subteraquimicrobiales bacterium]
MKDKQANDKDEMVKYGVDEGELEIEKTAGRSESTKHPGFTEARAAGDRREMFKFSRQVGKTLRFSDHAKATVFKDCDFVLPYEAPSGNTDPEEEKVKK